MYTTAAARARTRRILAALAAAVVLTHGAAAAGGQQYAGRRVADVLRDLRRQGLTLIFSSSLVPPTLRVTTEPKPGTAREIAEQIVAPHGLTLQDGPAGTLLVIRKTRGDRRPASPRSREPARKPEAADSTPEPIRIEEQVAVTERLRGSGGSRVYTMTTQLVRDAPGTMENVLQAFRTVPGVTMINDEDARFAVRGSGPEHNVIVLDGVQIHNPFRYGELASSFLNPDTAAHVSLDASGLDAAHGGRLSSVTVIETRDGTPGRRLALSGSLGLASGDVLLEGRLPNTSAGSWWLATRGTYYKPLFNLYKGNDHPGFGDVQFKVSLQPARHTKVSVFGLASRESLDLGRDDEDGGPARGYQGRNSLGILRLAWTPHARLAATTIASAYGHSARDTERIAVEPFARETSVADLALRQRVVYALSPSHVVDAGAEVHRIRSTWNMTGVKPPLFFRGLGPSTWGEGVPYAGPEGVRSDLARTDAGIWLQDQVTLGRRVTLAPGVRVDRNSYTEETAIQPRVRASVTLGSTALWTGFATQVQTPAHEALQGFDYFNLRPADGSRLRNERMRQVVAGFERSLTASTLVRVEAYYRRFTHLLAQRPETDVERAARLAGYELPPELPPDAVVLEHRPTAEAENAGRGTASGVEVLIQGGGPRLSGWLAYTFSRTRREQYGHSFPFDFDRPHAVSAVAAWRISRKMRASATIVAGSGFPATPVREEVTFYRPILPDGSPDPLRRPLRFQGGFLLSPDPGLRRLSLRNSERLNPYARLDVRFTYATLGNWEFYGEVINLLGTRNYLQAFPNPSQIGPPGTSRNNIYEAFERFPSFGIRFRF